MTSEDLAEKLYRRIDYMISQYKPRPECPTKQAAYNSLVNEIKGKVADKLRPVNAGIKIEIKV